VKIKEIVNEGLLSSYATGFLQGVGKGLMPDTLRKVYPDLKKDPFKGDPNPVEFAHDTFKKYGHNPEAPWTDPRSGKPLLPDKYGYFSWLTPYDIYQEKDRIVADLSDEERDALPDNIKQMFGIPINRTPAPVPAAPSPAPGPAPSAPPGPIPPGFEWDGSKFVPIKRKK
jgi:hypothetical protein